MDVRVQQECFDAGAELNGFDPNGAGAVVTFTGLVRDVVGGLEQMLIEHYPAMTEKALREIAADAEERWQLSNVLVIHRFGTLQPDEPIMMVATASLGPGRELGTLVGPRTTSRATRGRNATSPHLRGGRDGCGQARALSLLSAWPLRRT